MAITETLAVQQLQHDDHDLVFRTWYGCYSRVGPWGNLIAESPEPGPVPMAARDAMLDGPLPEFITQWEWWRRQWEDAFRRLDLPGDADAGADYLRTTLTNMDAYPDAHETIERIAAHGLRLGLLSNADEDFLQGAVSRNRLRFSVIQSSESLRAYKPHRVTFLALAQRLLCAPDEILYVGDSGYSDVHGASAAGLRTAWVRRSERPYPADLPTPDVEVTSLAEVADLVTGAPTLQN